ncbi:MAG: NAD-dependent epimerase/dehydratase family protein, partial [Planctomycetaceae bacterium]|nr:NAD-dependent epimerase/dehydratase family protein [Planctomycetaceae bacterium]
MKKRVLITGGAGFLGSFLCESMVERGHDVICLDNFFTSQKMNVQHLLSHSNFELVRHDITMPIWLEVDEIYNLACPAAPGHYQFNPI